LSARDILAGDRNGGFAMNRQAAARVLLAQGWLAREAPAVQRAILANSALVAFAEGEAVFHMDDDAGGTYAIAAGAVGLLVATEGRGPRLAHVLRRGAWFGHGPAVTGGRRTLGFRAMEPTVTLHVPLAALSEVARGGAAAARSLAALASANMAAAIATVSDLLVPRADRRIAATLLRATGAAAGMPPGDPAGYRLTQAELAEMANATRQTVNRSLRGFEDRGWVALGFRRIAVRNAAALAAFAAAEG
jgi:CRP-like cAMP-binding protein